MPRARLLAPIRADMIQPSLPRQWTPSRGRDIDGLCAMSAEQPQPAGAALPSLIAGSPSSEEARLADASSIAPSSLLSGRATLPDVKTGPYRRAPCRDSVNPLRKSALDAYASPSSRLVPHPPVQVVFRPVSVAPRRRH